MSLIYHFRMTQVTKKTTHETILKSFSPASEEEVNKILKNLPNKTCSLDAFPTWLLKECANELIPAITLIINCSLELADMPCILKRAVFRPVLKKSGLNKNDFKNYPPVSNLTPLSKTIEKIVTSRLQEYLNSHDFGTKFQSGYKSNCSSETALLRVLNDLLRLGPQGHPTMLVLLDLSEAFDTIDKHILIERFKVSFWCTRYCFKMVDIIHERSIYVCCCC